MLIKMKSEIERFLRTGDYDPLMTKWPGQQTLDRIKRGAETLWAALVAEVRRRETQVRLPVLDSLPGDLAGFARAKLAPMVRGLFPRAEHEPVLALLERSVAFLTPDRIESLIREAGFLGTAWQVANVYLVGIGAEPLDDEMRYVGMSADTTCYVSLAYFAEEDEFADFVVHEAAHVFHNVKRQTVGLPATRRRPWLLPIAFRKRETFAYACEAYSRILEVSRQPAERQRLFDKRRERPPPPDERVNADEYFEILAEAVSRRNGWKAILARCSEKKSPSQIQSGAA